MITLPLDSTYPISSFKTSAKADCIIKKVEGVDTIFFLYSHSIDLISS